MVAVYNVIDYDNPIVKVEMPGYLFSSIPLLSGKRRVNAHTNGL